MWPSPEISYHKLATLLFSTTHNGEKVQQRLTQFALELSTTQNVYRT